MICTAFQFFPCLDMVGALVWTDFVQLEEVVKLKVETMS